jgi:hypothetical protein
MTKGQHAMQRLGLVASLPSMKSRIQLVFFWHMTTVPFLTTSLVVARPNRA